MCYTYHVLFPLKFAYCWRFSHIHQTEVFAKTKLKAWEKFMIYQRGRDRGQSHLSFLSLFLCCKIFILSDRYPIILEIFPIWVNCDLDFAKIGSQQICIEHLLYAEHIARFCKHTGDTQIMVLPTKGARKLVGKTHIKEVISLIKCKRTEFRSQL